MATHSSVLTWRIPGMEEPGVLPSMGSHRVGHDWSDLAAAAAGIPSPPLALFVVMLPKPTWLHIPGCLALGEWLHHRGYLSHKDFFCFLYSSSVYSCHLFLICSVSVRSIPFLSFIVPVFAWNVPLVSLIFLKRSLVFSILLFPLFLCIDLWGRLSYVSVLFLGTLHSNGYIFPFLLCLHFSSFHSYL